MVWRALTELAALARRPDLAPLINSYDPHAGAEQRLPAVDALRAALGPGPLSAERREALEVRQDAVMLWIGE